MDNKILYGIRELTSKQPGHVRDLTTAQTFLYVHIFRQEQFEKHIEQAWLHGGQLGLDLGASRCTSLQMIYNQKAVKST